MISLLIILINRIKDIVYCSTEKKTLKSNATIQFKLGNFVRAKKHRGFLNFIKNLYC